MDIYIYIERERSERVAMLSWAAALGSRRRSDETIRGGRQTFADDNLEMYHIMIR